MSRLQGLAKHDEQLLSPKSCVQDSVLSNQMVDKLSRENNELKKQIEHQKKAYKSKLDELRVLLGIEADLEALIKARANSREMHALKFYREARERAETLGRINRDLEKKMMKIQNDVDVVREERLVLEKKYYAQFRAMEDKVEAMK